MVGSKIGLGFYCNSEDIKNLTSTKLKITAEKYHTLQLDKLVK